MAWPDVHVATEHNAAAVLNRGRWHATIRWQRDPRGTQLAGDALHPRWLADWPRRQPRGCTGDRAQELAAHHQNDSERAMTFPTPETLAAIERLTGEATPGPVHADNMGRIVAADGETVCYGSDDAVVWMFGERDLRTLVALRNSAESLLSAAKRLAKVEPVVEAALLIADSTT